MNRQTVSVSELNNYITNMVRQEFYLKDLSVKGEVSNLTYHGSGHIYFTLKDAGGVIKCVMFAGERRGLTFPMQAGDKVVVTGFVDVYGKGGYYQLRAQRIEPEGRGDLQQQFEALKAQLEEMGMFSDEYKKPIPKYVRRIGIVTAPTGQAVKDMVKVATARNPHLQIIIYPALVQGDGAKESIARGIARLDEMNLDVLLVGRGGGSLEDLWAFNEELVAKAIFACNTPVISAVGHEGDVTIADLVADRRASTPSNAAELAVYPFSDLAEAFDMRTDRLYDIMMARLQQAHYRAQALGAGLEAASPQNKLRHHEQTLDALSDRLNFRMNDRLKTAAYRMKMAAQRLEMASPVRKLSGGYAYLSDEAGHAITTIKEIKPDDAIRLDVTDGAIRAIVTETVARD